MLSLLLPVSSFLNAMVAMVARGVVAKVACILHDFVNPTVFVRHVILIMGLSVPEMEGLSVMYV